VNDPAIKVFWPAQVSCGDTGFVSKDIIVRDMLAHHGDIHHIFPKNFLKQLGLAKGKYNQVVNFVLMQQEMNSKISETVPATYMAEGACSVWDWAGTLRSHYSNGRSSSQPGSQLPAEHSRSLPA